MTNKAIVTFGGPFPYDKSFRGQMFVMGDLVKEAVNRKMKSCIISKYHEKRDLFLAAMERNQKAIARLAFLSELEFRYREEFALARQAQMMANQGKMPGGIKAWGSFYGIDKIKELMKTHSEVYYFMHYYNARFKDAEYFSELVKAEGLCRSFNGYYFIHIAPDQMIESDNKGKWRERANTGDAVESLVRAIGNDCFKSFIAVSEATKSMWLELISEFGYPREMVSLAERKIRAVPNGIDYNVYDPSSIGKREKEMEKEKIGFDKGVKKIVLIMTRPSISKGIERVQDILREFETCPDPAMRDIGFIVAMPESKRGTAKFISEIRKFRKLIQGNRLKVTIDISKIVRNSFEVADEFDEIQRMAPISYSNEQFYMKPINCPLTHVSDILLHVPYAEAFGLVLAEALLSGCAVVTTNAGGIGDVVKHSKSTIILDHENMRISDAIHGLLTIEKPLAHEHNFIRQFSLKNQFDRIIGGKDE